jgi:hypothetical protein
VIVLSLPLILNDDGDLSFFDSAHHLQRYVEPIDAASQGAFDADGQRLELVVNGGRVLLASFDPPRYEADALELVLHNFLVATGRASPKMALNELVSLCVRSFGYTR